VLTYNLANLPRRLTLPKRIENWSLTSLQEQLVKAGGRLVKLARYYWILLAESLRTGGDSEQCCEGCVALVTSNIGEP
jgi:hypothetical protein